MKDKEKQIWQDVANVMCECEDKENFTQKYRTKCRGCGLSSVIRHIVFFLNNSDYRKLPDDSVVLSREEYEKLKKFEYRVQSGVCMTQKEWFDFCNEDSNRRTCLRIEEREKERKETAEKFIKECKKYKVKKFSPVGIDQRDKGVSWIEMPEWKLDELAKQLGVEIKE